MRNLIFSADAEFNVSQKEGGRPVVDGYAIVWGAMTNDDRRDRKGEYKVRILPGSAQFERPTFALYNHSWENVLGQTGNGTLTLAADDRGVKFALELPDTNLGRDLSALIANKTVRGMSFSAKPTDFFESTEAGVRVINFKTFKASEITITPRGAFSEPSVGIRGEGLTMSAGGESIDFSDAPSLAADQIKLERYRLDRFAWDLAQLRKP